MKIRLKAMGETSPLTGRKKLLKGAVVEATKAQAAEAIKSGRWEAVKEAETPENEGGTGD